MAKKTKAASLTIEEKLEQALVVPGYEPYKIPDNWCWTTLEYAAKWGSGGTPSRKVSEYYLGDIPWIKTGELDNDFVYETEEHISEAAIRNSSAKLYPVNTVMIAMYGATIGKVGIMGVKATTNQACANAVCGKNIYYKYLFYYAISQKDSFISKGKGGAQPNISQEVIKKHEFPLPPLPEQQRIVERIESLFSKLDEAKEKAQEVINSFETIKAAILHKAFSGELTAKWREKNEGESWENIPLAEFATIVSGFAFSSNDFNKQNGVPCVKITNVGVGEYYADEYEYLPDAYLNEYPQFVVNYGDVLISLTRSYINTGLKVCIYLEPKKALLNQRVALIKNCNTQYLYYYLCSNSVLTYIKEKSKTTNQPNLSIKDLRNLIIPVASSEEQQIIVEELDSLLSKEIISKQAAEALIDQIDIMKKSILSRAFRGELGTNDPKEESAVELLKQILSGE